MKKIILIVIVFSLFSMPSFAMNETDFIKYLTDKGFSAEYITYAQKHFENYSYSAEQLDTLKTYIESTLDIAMSKNPEAITQGLKLFNEGKFTHSEKDQIVDNVMKASQVLGIKAIVKRETDSIHEIEFLNNDGKRIGIVYPMHKNYEFANNITFYIHSGLFLLLTIIFCASLIVLSRHRFTKKIIS